MTRRDEIRRRIVAARMKNKDLVELLAQGLDVFVELDAMVSAAQAGRVTRAMRAGSRVAAEFREFRDLVAPLLED